MQDNYNVGGLILPRPFWIRKLSHVGIYYSDFDSSMRFYNHILGFRASDIYGSKMSKYHPGLERLGPWQRCFLSNNIDHHTLVLAPAALRSKDSQQTTLQQFSWEVGSLDEVRNGRDFMKAHQVPIDFVGKRMPGGNYNLYVLDPDHHRVELGWGHEQVGWTGYSKTANFWESERLDGNLPDGSVISPAAIDRADFEKLNGNIPQAEHSLNIMGYSRPPISEKYEVGGVLEDRPFRLTRPKQVSIFVRNMEASLRFFTDILGFTISHMIDSTSVAMERNVQGNKVVMLAHDIGYPSLCLYPMELRDSLGRKKETSLVRFAFEVQSYQQLYNSISYFERSKVPILNKGKICDGHEYVVDVSDPDGHELRLWYRDERKESRPGRIEIPPWRPTGQLSPVIQD